MRLSASMNAPVRGDARMDAEKDSDWLGCATLSRLKLAANAAMMHKLICLCAESPNQAHAARLLRRPPCAHPPLHPRRRVSAGALHGASGDAPRTHAAAVGRRRQSPRAGVHARRVCVYLLPCALAPVAAVALASPALELSAEEEWSVCGGGERGTQRERAGYVSVHGQRAGAATTPLS